jgi:hypothetical protein
MSEHGLASVETAWRDLTAALEGEVVLPGSRRYDEVRRPQIPRFHDLRPQAVVLSYWGGNLERVRSVKERYDPERVLG